ncbi:MAG: hypothetical protein IMW92_14000 [Bacillales bacterium]|nr:hypothetical protein [Bacillales bacterium]
MKSDSYKSDLNMGMMRTLKRSKKGAAITTVLAVLFSHCSSSVMKRFKNLIRWVENFRFTEPVILNELALPMVGSGP